MDARHLSRGDWLTAGAALLLLVCLFLPWYGAGGETATAWETMAMVDVLLALAALLALIAVVLAARAPTAGFTMGTTSFAAILATIGALFALIRVLSPAPEVDVSREIGAWLGLLSAIGLAASAWLAMRDEGPARRNPAAERAAADDALARAELLALPPEPGSTGSSGARA